MRGITTLVPTGFDPGLTANVMLWQFNWVPHWVVAAQAVYVGIFVGVMLAEMTPKASGPTGCPATGRFPPEAYTGNPGSTPTLQDGGVQEAVTFVPPELARAARLLLPEVLVALENDATSGFEELQLSGGLVSVVPKVSTTVASMLFEPLFRVKEFPVTP